jgi:hypothetical protein
MLSVLAQCRVPGSLASADERGNERSLFSLQPQQGNLHEGSFLSSSSICDVIYSPTSYQYVQFGNTFNLLHAAAAFISDHQKSIGVGGVSDKYGKRSWARYPALWTLKHVDSLPNPGTCPDNLFLRRSYLPHGEIRSQ